MLNELLKLSAQLEAELAPLATITLCDSAKRYQASKIMCNIAFEHAESVKILLARGNYTSSIGLVRLQYEALVRATWLTYAAPDREVEKVMAELTADSAKKANKLPMLSAMLNELEGKAPEQALEKLLEFKEYSWKPLSSFVHGGIHAINRHSKGYPVALIIQALKASNGVSVMVGMMSVVLHGGREYTGVITDLQKRYAECLPPVIQSN